MSCSAIEYANQTIRSNNTTLRLIPLAVSDRRIPPRYPLTLAGAVAIAEEEATITAATTKKLWAGETLLFDEGNPGQVSAQLSKDVPVGETVLPITPAVAAIGTGLVASAWASVYIAGVTDAAPVATPVVEPSGNLLSGDNYEAAIVGNNITLPLTIDRTDECPGQKLILDSLFAEEYLGREIYVIYERPNGERYAGAAIATTGSQTGRFQTKATMQVNFQLLGCSVTFRHAFNAAAIDWPAA